MRVAHPFVERWVGCAALSLLAVVSAGCGVVKSNNPALERVRDAYGRDKYDRLVALKDAYDPTNLFRLNQNIAPSGG